MDVCGPCEEQAKKSSNGRPHDDLLKIDAGRCFKGSHAREFKEQDYRCQKCSARFTWSSNKNDLAWTLWQG